MNKEHIIALIRREFELHNTTDRPEQLFSKIADLLIDNQPPKSAGVKTATEYLSHFTHEIIPGDYDMVPEQVAIKALAAQAWDHEIELEEFAQFCEDKNGEYATAADLLYEFRNQKPRG